MRTPALLRVLAALVVVLGAGLVPPQPAGGQTPPAPGADPDAPPTTLLAGPPTTLLAGPPTNLLAGPPTTLLAGPPTTAPVITDPATATDPATIGDDRLSPELLQVAVESPEYDAAMGSYRTLAAQLDQARATYRTAETALVELEAQEGTLRQQRRAARTRRTAAERLIAELQATIDDLLVTSYVNGDTSGALGSQLAPADATAQGSRRALTDSMFDLYRSDLRAAIDDRDRSRRDEDRAAALLESVVARRDETRFVRDSSQVAAYVLAGELTEQARAVADARLTARVVGADFQLVALDAYVKAAGRLALDAPDCRLRWQVLAGISRTEGRHGTYGGSRLDGTGRVDPPIIGIQLNGSNNTAAITDTDGGQWDGDPTHDRAVGPMQFIPGSWRYYGADGDGDGEIDPQNLYDAALAAGRLLCRNSAGYDTEEGRRRGLLSYNHSNHYVDVVSGYIEAYDRLELWPPAG